MIKGVLEKCYIFKMCRFLKDERFKEKVKQIEIGKLDILIWLKVILDNRIIKEYNLIELRLEYEFY